MIVGVDIDTWKLTLCAFRSDGPAWATAELRDRRGADLFDAIQATQLALPLAVATLSQFERPTEFHVERGRGKFRTADFDLGAIYGATVVALGRACPGAHVAPMSPQKWKRVVTAAVGIKTVRGAPGNANASKEVANKACRVLLERTFGRPDRELSADELDAYGIAYAASDDEDGSLQAGIAAA